MKTKPLKDIINVITLGCSKNLVDSEFLMRQILANHIEVVHNSESFKFKTVIINTCGFIKDAKEESIDTILNFIKAKEAGLINRVYVMGCLSERYKKELENEIPEVDQYFGAKNIQEIIKALDGKYKTELAGERLTTTPAHYAYLKISEGCNRTCSFCAIPMIRGLHQSNTIEQIVVETKNLVKQGKKEIILIAQDLTYYGYDLYKKNRLYDLLNSIADIQGVEWIRLHYAYPAGFPVEILKVIRERENICKYLDIPLQHISSQVLKKMHRHYTKQFAEDLIEKIKNEIPGIALRTTMMVGHPGEGEKEFGELIEFVSKTKFDRLGVFTYSKEEGTYAALHYQDRVSDKIKEKRMEELMALQSGISYENNQRRIGKVYKSIIDRREGDFYIGRTEYDSPEVDNEILITGHELKQGSFYQVQVMQAEEYDLYGTVN